MVEGQVDYKTLPDVAQAKIILQSNLENDTAREGDWQWQRKEQVRTFPKRQKQKCIEYIAAKISTSRKCTVEIPLEDLMHN